MNHGIEFHTVTCLNWSPLLAFDERKEIITSSLKYLVENQKIYLYGFVIISNHIHFIWEVREKWVEKNIKQNFLKFTAQQIKFGLSEKELNLYKSTQKDRGYHFWERRSWKASLTSRDVVEQKLDYIHANPVKAGLVEHEEDYEYSSFKFYNQKDTKWNFITHYTERI